MSSVCLPAVSFRTEGFCCRAAQRMRPALPAVQSAPAGRGLAPDAACMQPTVAPFPLLTPQPPEFDEYGNWIEPAAFEAYDSESGAEEVRARPCLLPSTAACGALLPAQLLLRPPASTSASGVMCDVVLIIAASGRPAVSTACCWLAACVGQLSCRRRGVLCGAVQHRATKLPSNRWTPAAHLLRTRLLRTRSAGGPLARFRLRLGRGGGGGPPGGAGRHRAGPGVELRPVCRPRGKGRNMAGARSRHCTHPARCAWLGRGRPTTAQRVTTHACSRHRPAAPACLQGVAEALVEALRRAGGGTVVMCDPEVGHPPRVSFLLFPLPSVPGSFPCRHRGDSAAVCCLFPSAAGVACGAAADCFLSIWCGP